MPPAKKTPAKKAAKRASTPRKAPSTPRKTAAAKPPATLGARGRRLWTDLHAGVKRDPATSALIEEACRLTDRLDRLDALLRGDTAAWAWVHLPDDGTELVLRIDPALAEARQHATALRGLLTPLTAPVKAAADPPKPEANRADELAAARASRLAASARP